MYWGLPSSRVIFKISGLLNSDICMHTLCMWQHFSITASIFLLETHPPSQLAQASPDTFYPGMWPWWLKPVTDGFQGGGKKGQEVHVPQRQMRGVMAAASPGNQPWQPMSWSHCQGSQEMQRALPMAATSCCPWRGGKPSWPCCKTTRLWRRQLCLVLSTMLGISPHLQPKVASSQPCFSQSGSLSIVPVLVCFPAAISCLFSQNDSEQHLSKLGKALSPSHV